MKSGKKSDPRVFLSYARIGYKAQLQYKGSVAVTCVFILIGVLLDPAELFVLFDRFGSPGGWSAARVFATYGIAVTAFGLAETLTRGLDYITHLVRGGELDRYLVRPRGVLMQVMAARFHFSRFSRVAGGAAITLFSLRALGAPTSGGAVMLLLALTGGVLMYIGVFVAIGASAVLLVGDIDPLFTLAAVSYQAAKAPPPCLPEALSRALTFVLPVFAFAFVPLECVYGASLPFCAGWLALPACAAFLALSLLYFRAAMGRYASAGG